MPAGSFDSEDKITHDVNLGSWRRETTGLPNLEKQGTNHLKTAKEIRDGVCEYLNSDAGSVSWQNDAVSRGNM